MASSLKTREIAGLLNRLAPCLTGPSPGALGWFFPLCAYRLPLRPLPINMVDGVGATAYGYTAAGQVLSEDGPWSRDTVSFTYQNRRRTGVAVQAPNASDWTQAYSYDPSGRLTNTVSPAGAFGYDYAIAKLVRKLSLPGGSYITNFFDSDARLLGTILKDPQHLTLNGHLYAYNPANQRTQQVFTATNYVDYTYDRIGQLKTAKGNEAGGTSRVHEQFGYAYDAAGNLSYRTNNALLQTFTVNNLNELSSASRSGTLTVAGSVSAPVLSITVSGTGLSSGPATLYSDKTWVREGASPANGANSYTASALDSLGRQDTTTVNTYLPATPSYAYDENGNLLSDGRRGFAYDDENQLISITVTNSWQSRFLYDGKMRRRVRIECTWNSGAWQTNDLIRYVYDGNLVIQERNNGNMPVVTYTHGTDLSATFEGAGGIGGLLARTVNPLLNIGDGAAHAYYSADGNGNVTCLINTNAIIVAKYLYGPFGNILAQSGPLAEANLYRFSSKEFHASSGLVYYLYRCYEPSLQRWLNRDPIGEGPGANLYEFVGNDSVDNEDAEGLETITNQGCTITAYCSKGPGADWPHFKPGKPGGKPKSVGPGSVACANTKPPAWPFGTKVTIYGPDGRIIYIGEIHDTGAGWDPRHHNVPPGSWFDVWLASKKKCKEFGEKPNCTVVLQTPEAPQTNPK